MVKAVCSSIGVACFTP
ncbi:hypothetical protein QX242_24105 [Vibrio parahaemolyticus]|nr:hypothetical protein [Vibrio parahaemolyticus]